MRKTLFIICLIGMLSSCSSHEDNIDPNLIGIWKLSEVNNDPGDGSGVFLKVSSDKTLSFKEHKIITSNGSLCENTITSDTPSKGTFELNENSSLSGKIKSPDCNRPLSEVSFEIKESVLYVYYSCIEGCKAKYIKQK